MIGIGYCISGLNNARPESVPEHAENDGCPTTFLTSTTKHAILGSRSGQGRNGMETMMSSKNRFTLKVLFLSIVLVQPLLAQELAVGTVSGAPGDTVELPVDFTSDGTVVSLQFDLNFNPSQLSTGVPVGGSALGDHVVASSTPAPGVRRLLVYSLTNSALKTGTLVSLPVNIDQNANPGTLSINLSGVILSDANSSAVSPTSVVGGNVIIEFGRASLALTALEAPVPVTVGDTLTYTFGITNSGPSTATDVQVTNELPSAVAFVSAVASQGSCAEADSTVTCELGTVASGASATVTIEVKTIRAGRIVNTVRVEGAQVDPEEADNLLSAQTRVVPILVFPVTLNARTVPSGESLTTLAPPFQDTFVGVAILNPNDTATELALSGVGSEGVERITSALEAPLAANNQLALLASELLEPAEGVVALLARGTQRPVQGFFLAGGNNLDRLDGIGGTLTESERLYFPIARQGGTKATLLFVHNPGPVGDPNVTFEIFDTQGNLVGEASLAIPASGTVMASLADLFSGELIIEDGYVRVAGTVPLKGFEFLAGEGNFSALAAQSESSVQRLLVPHFFLDNQGSETEVLLLNVDSASVVVNLQAFDDSSNLLASAELRIEPGHLLVGSVRSLLELNPQAVEGSEVITGYLDLRTTPVGFAARLVGAVTFTGNQGKARSTLPMIEEGQTESLFLHVAESVQAGLFTGFAILNAENETTTVTLEAFDERGVQTAQVQFTLEAGSRVVDLLSGKTFFGGDFNQVNGHIELSSTTPVVTFALFGDFNSEFLAAIESQPPIQ